MCFLAASYSRRLSSSNLALETAASYSAFCFLIASSYSFFSSAILFYLSYSVSLLAFFCYSYLAFSSCFSLIFLSWSSCSIIYSTSFFCLALIFSIALSSWASIDEGAVPWPVIYEVGLVDPLKPLAPDIPDPNYIVFLICDFWLF